jgi:ATP-binding cassette subfamily F protein 2
VAQEIWVCEKETVTKWQGDILAYKSHLKDKIISENRLKAAGK